MRSIWLSFAFAAGMAAMGGCAVAPLAPAVVNVVQDPFSPLTIFEGPKVRLDEGGTSDYTLFNIRSWVGKKSGKVTHQLYAELHYSGNWHFYDRASDEHAASLSVGKIDARVLDCTLYCSYVETVGIDLDDAQLRASDDIGYSVKLYGKSGDATVMTLTPQWIHMQFKAIADYLQSAKITQAAQ